MTTLPTHPFSLAGGTHEQIQAAAWIVGVLLAETPEQAAEQMEAFTSDYLADFDEYYPRSPIEERQRVVALARAIVATYHEDSKPGSLARRIASWMRRAVPA